MHATLTGALYQQPGLCVRDLLTEASRTQMLPTFLQGGSDVHGSHPLFYWLRARGSGIIVTSREAGVVLTWRRDVDRLIALRPVGAATAVVDLLHLAAQVARAAAPSKSFVARYCTADVGAQLRERGWSDMAEPWQPSAPHDDETFPEVVVTAPVVESPAGQRYKPLRQALSAHTGHYRYSASTTPLGIGEVGLIRTDAARVDDYDAHEIGFNEAVLSSLTNHQHDWVTYHYLTQRGEVTGFAITATVTDIAHGYYLCTLDVPRLTTFFLWHIYLQQRRAGASALNLGGSEHASLHEFKTRTFPDHELRHTVVLAAPK